MASAWARHECMQVKNTFLEVCEKSGAGALGGDRFATGGERPRAQSDPGSYKELMARDSDFGDFFVQATRTTSATCGNACAAAAPEAQGVAKDMGSDATKGLPRDVSEKRQAHGAAPKPCFNGAGYKLDSSVARGHNNDNAFAAPARRHSATAATTTSPSVEAFAAPAAVSTSTYAEGSSVRIAGATAAAMAEQQTDDASLENLLRRNARLDLYNKLLRENARLSLENESLQGCRSSKGGGNSPAAAAVASAPPAAAAEAASFALPAEVQQVLGRPTYLLDGSPLAAVANGGLPAPQDALGQNVALNGVTMDFLMRLSAAGAMGAAGLPASAAASAELLAAAGLGASSRGCGAASAAPARLQTEARRAPAPPGPVLAAHPAAGDFASAQQPPQARMARQGAGARGGKQGRQQQQLQLQQQRGAQGHAEEGAIPGCPEQRTTLMLQNLPNSYSRSMLLAMLDGEGFKGLYDFVYLPMDYSTTACFGYAFVNVVDPSVVPAFWDTFTGYSRWVLPSKKACNVAWCCSHQGLEAMVKRYRDSPVMHAAVPEEYRPVLLQNGVPVPFPPPTKVPRGPRPARQGQASR